MQTSIYCFSDGMEGGLLSMSLPAPLLTNGNLQITIKITLFQRYIIIAVKVLFLLLYWCKIFLNCFERCSCKVKFLQR